MDEPILRKLYPVVVQELSMCMKKDLTGLTDIKRDNYLCWMGNPLQFNSQFKMQLFFFPQELLGWLYFLSFMNLLSTLCPYRCTFDLDLYVQVCR